MIRYENRCCDCSSPGYPCIGSLCSRRYVKIYECDCCKDEVNYGELYYFNGKELCISCIKKELEIVE